MTALFSSDDCYPSATSDLQAHTEHVLSERRAKPRTDKEPSLDKNNHIQFLARNLLQGFPSRYTSQDASQPWLSFWTLHSLSILQVSLDPGNKQKAIDTILTWQHPDGGFGGGPGQAAHLLPTYASVCALAISGRPGPGGGWDQIKRDKVYAFFMSLKQPDGSFLVAHHAEVDVRGIYCLLVTATLLNILTPELIAGTAEFLASCQTYEGGFASSSQPYFSATPDSETESAKALLDKPRPPLGEAHGGYTFCAVASLVLIQSFEGQESTRLPQINVRNLLRWLVQMQGTAAELGGFKGRTNKLVDGCYSWWVGGAFSLLSSLGLAPPHEHSGAEEGAESWDDVDDALFNREALQTYILMACQHHAGGLVDKPPKGPDAYHTMYCLAGLASAQHTLSPSASRKAEIRRAWKNTDDEFGDLRKNVFLETLSWHEETGTQCILGGAQNKVNATHPLFNLTVTHSEGIMGHFYRQTIPPVSIRMKQPE